jgi:hypothetical protein
MARSSAIDRLGSRLVRIAQALESDPTSGFPKPVRSDAELEGTLPIRQQRTFQR